MRVSALAAIMIITTVLLSGCAQDNKAMVENRGGNYYGHDSIATGPTYQAAEVGGITSRDVPPPSSAPISQASVAPAAPAISDWQWPVDGQVIARFGAQENGVANPGIAIAAAEGTPVRAAKAGEVAFVGTDVADYGNMVILRHANGNMTSYAHAKTIAVRKGDQVAAGTVIATVGSSGGVNAPQLHFALREGNRTIDPLTKLPHQMATR